MHLSYSMDLSLKKSEIIRSKKSITELFENGSFFFIYPFKIYFQPVCSQTNHMVLFSVSKRHFKKAVDRNWIKRRMRESYRLNKHSIITDWVGACFLNIAFVYVSDKKLTFHEIDSKLREALVRLKNTIIS